MSIQVIPNDPAQCNVRADLLMREQQWRSRIRLVGDFQSEVAAAKQALEMQHQHETQCATCLRTELEGAA